MANHPVGRFWLALPWIMLACGLPTLAWWMFEPVPLTVNYVAPCFMERPVSNREEALQSCVTQTRGGGVLYRWAEYCVSRAFEATSHRSWVGRAVVWPAPDLPTIMSRTPGCYSTNFAVEIPTSSPSRSWEFVQRMEIQMAGNPLRSPVIEYAPIPLTILDSKDK
ncbi:MAG: hypothetical protein MUC51_07165 [Anaerolineae bacterium]|jgi:hypothetical protein|nr:hypothetical protein [Anaerolineae bacterium]